MKENRRFFWRAKAKQDIAERKAAELAANAVVSDNESSVAPADPWKREAQFTPLAKAKSIRGLELCQHCAWKPPKASMLHAHHITPRSCGGSDDQKNLIVLCPNCHAIAHFVTAMSRLQRKYTGPSTAIELQEWMRLAYKPAQLREKQRAFLVASVHPLIDSLTTVQTSHNPA